jgi:HSP20 family molecular chaperone IbpA
VRKEGKTLNQILSGLGDLLEGLSGLVESGTDALESVGSRTGRNASVTYGWSIGSASGSRPHDDADRDAPPPRPQPRAAAVQEFFDEGEYIRTVIEVPGVVDGDIHFHVNGQELTIDARRHRGRNILRLRVPSPVSAEGATSSYRNGIFEILLPKQRTANGSR